ncbi:MAG: plasmid mobilization relaxosome protein MobC [Bacteroidota bacterium]
MKKKKIKNVGRPKVPEELKYKGVNFTASPTLIADINEKADLLFGGNKTKYIVHMLTQNSGPQLENTYSNIDKAELFKLIKEVNKIGTNVNQIARRTNLGFRKDEPLKIALEETQNKIDEVIVLMNMIIQFGNPNFK